MDERSIPSTAIYGGNLARTFEYRTTGVHATPHLHWSFPLREGATISCPVLVAENVVYVGDSAGFFSALDAHSGDLLWCFATDWALDERTDHLRHTSPGVTAFCLAGRVGYVASSYHTLYEVDLRNGQAIRSWDEEAQRIKISCEISSLLFYDQLVWYPSGDGSVSRLDPATGSIATFLFFYYGPPVIYCPPHGDCDVIYGRQLIEPSPLGNFYSISFLAINLPLSGLSDPLDLAGKKMQTITERWWMGEGDGKEVCEEIHEDMYTVMDETLYAVCHQFSLNGTPLSTELLALDPFTAAVQWRHTLLEEGDDPYDHLIHLAASSHLIFLVTRKGVEAIDTHTHQRRWTWTSNDDNWPLEDDYLADDYRQAMGYRRALVADGLLFVLDKAGQITALDALTGEQRWNWQTEQPITGEVSTIADATLYLALGHTLCAFR